MNEAADGMDVRKHVRRLMWHDDIVPISEARNFYKLFHK